MNPLDDWHAARSTGRMGAINPSGDVIVEIGGVARLHVRSSARPSGAPPYPAFVQKIGNIVNQGIFPGMGGGGGGLALNQLLVVMDGIDNPPFLKRVFTNKTNAFLDAIYFVPRRVGKAWGVSFGACDRARRRASLLAERPRHDHGLPDPLRHERPPTGSSGACSSSPSRCCIIYLGVEAFRSAAQGRDAVAAAPARQADRRADLLHRRDERPGAEPRPGAHAPGPHGPPHHLPDADEGRPQGHLRPLPRQGRARPRPRHARARATRSRGSRAATRRR